MTSSLLIKKREYLWNEKKYSKKENAILLYSKKSFKWAAISFYFIGTLKTSGYPYILCHEMKVVSLFNKWLVSGGE